MFEKILKSNRAVLGLVSKKIPRLIFYTNENFVLDCQEIDQKLNDELLRAAKQNDKEKVVMLIKNCGDVNAASSTLGNTIPHD